MGMMLMAALMVCCPNWLGELMLHVPIFRLLVFAYGGAAHASYPLIALGVTASIAAAIVFATCYEEPLRAILSARLRGPGRKQAQGAD